MIDKQSQEIDLESAARSSEIEGSWRGPRPPHHLLSAHGNLLAAALKGFGCTQQQSTTTGATRRCGWTVGGRIAIGRREWEPTSSPPPADGRDAGRDSILIFVMLRLVPATSPTSSSTRRLRNPAAEEELRRTRPRPADRGDVRHLDRWTDARRPRLRHVSEKPAIDEILPRIPVTAKLALLARSSPCCCGVPL